MNGIRRFCFSMNSLPRSRGWGLKQAGVTMAATYRTFVSTAGRSDTRVFPYAHMPSLSSSLPHQHQPHYLQQLLQHQHQQHGEQRRFISKYISKSAKKRMPMTTKRAGKGFYKGNRSTKEGIINSKGRFITNPLRQLELVAPDLEGFALKPYVSRSASKVPPELRR
mmetsp:Transcript_49055/g.118837  ORF Transcript_49055/g.118837 Transcript_49055/m.118837 type:complete len:166 (-) Transcript_49055:527-1024(-)